MAKSTKPVAFETAFQRLEQIVDALESGDKSLEDNLKLFEEGIELTRQCREQLAQAEERIKVLVKNDAGGFEVGELDQ